MGPGLGFLTLERMQDLYYYVLRERYLLENYHVMPSGNPLREPTTCGDMVMSTGCRGAPMPLGRLPKGSRAKWSGKRDFKPLTHV